MKTTGLNRIVVCASFGALCTAHLPAVVEENGTRETSTVTDTHSLSSSKLCRAADLLGCVVTTESNEKVGEVRDVLIDPMTGRVPFVLVSSGGFFGAGDKWIALPVASLSRGTDRRAVVVSIESGKLKNAPTWDRNRGAFDQAWATEVYHYYDLQPYWQVTASDQEMREPAGAESVQFISDSLSGNPDERADRILRLYQKGKAEAARIDRLLQEGRLDLDGTSDVAFHPYRTGSVAEQSSLVTVSESRESRFTRSTDLMGYQVKNSLDERIGEIKDVVIDLSAGRVTYYVVSMGNRMLAFPPKVIERSTDHGNTFLVNLDRENLSTAPTFEQSDWNHSSDPAYIREIYRFYGVPMYFQSRTSGDEIREPAGSELKKPGIMKDPAGADREKMKDSDKSAPKRENTDKVTPRDENIPRPEGDAVPAPNSVHREEKE